MNEQYLKDIIFIKSRRYYKVNLSVKKFDFEYTAPFCFIHNDYMIHEGSWNRMALSILMYLDSINPLDDEVLLSLEYEWSKASVFSRVKRTNYTKFKNIYLNTNHTALHSMWSIQFLLSIYKIDLSGCQFFIKRHPISEDVEVREYFKNQTMEKFLEFLLITKWDKNGAHNILKYVDKSNIFLKKVSQGYDDFYLIDDSVTAQNYSIKTLEYIKTKCRGLLNNTQVKIVERAISEYVEFVKFKCRSAGIYVYPDEFMNALELTIDDVFNKYNIDTITSSKVYGLLKLKYPNFFKEYNEMFSKEFVFNGAAVTLGKKYKIQLPFISKKYIINPSYEKMTLELARKEDIIDVKKLFCACDELHILVKPSKVELFNELHNEYVLVDCNKYIKKNCFKIDEETKVKIKDEIMFVIRNFGNVSSSKHFSYEFLPKINVPWSVYSLLGVVATYYSDSFNFSVENISNKTILYEISIK